MNYLIIGGDGKEYGPVSEEQIRVWFREGRVNAQTRIAAEEQREWKPLAAYAAFAELCQTVPPLIAGGNPVPPSGAGPITEPTALASLVLGILSLLCFSVLTGIPAIICGHIARARIRQAQGALSGNVMAIVGLVLGYLSLIGVLFIIGALYPALNSAKHKAHEVSCMNNLKQIGLACRMYAADNNENLPADLNSLAQQNYLTGFKTFVCPGTKTAAALNAEQFSRGGHCDYQYFGMNQKEGPDLNKTILAADRSGNHADAFNIVFADGHTMRFNGKSLEEIALKNGYILMLPASPAAAK